MQWNRDICLKYTVYLQKNTDMILISGAAEVS